MLCYWKEEKMWKGEEKALLRIQFISHSLSLIDVAILTFLRIASNHWDIGSLGALQKLCKESENSIFQRNSIKLDSDDSAVDRPACTSDNRTLHNICDCNNGPSQSGHSWRTIDSCCLYSRPEREHHRC